MIKGIKQKYSSHKNLKKAKKCAFCKKYVILHDMFSDDMCYECAYEHMNKL